MVVAAYLSSRCHVETTGPEPELYRLADGLDLPRMDEGPPMLDSGHPGSNCEGRQERLDDAESDVVLGQASHAAGF